MTFELEFNLGLSVPF